MGRPQRYCRWWDSYTTNSFFFFWDSYTTNSNKTQIITRKMKTKSSESPAKGETTVAGDTGRVSGHLGKSLGESGDGVTHSRLKETQAGWGHRPPEGNCLDCNLGIASSSKVVRGLYKEEVNVPLDFQVQLVISKVASRCICMLPPWMKSHTFRKTQYLPSLMTSHVLLLISLSILWRALRGGMGKDYFNHLKTASYECH